MSERAKLHGKSAPPHVLTHDGKTYTIPAALDIGDLLDIEELLYQRSIQTLAMQREAMDPADYRQELAALRKHYDDGDYSFEGPIAQAFMHTRKGATMLFGRILGIDDEKELTNLLAHKRAEVESIVESVMAATLPNTEEAPKEERPPIDPQPTPQVTPDPKARRRPHRPDGGRRA